MVKPTVQMFSIPLGNEVYVIFRIRSSKGLFICFCFSQVSAKSFLTGSLYKSLVDIRVDCNMAMQMLEDDEVPDFHEYSEIVFEGHFAHLLSQALDSTKVMIKDEIDFSEIYPIFQATFDRCMHIPNPIKEVRKDNDHDDYAAVYTRAKPYEVKIFFNKVEALYLHQQTGQKKIRKVIMHSLIPFESIESTQEYDGIVAEMVAYLFFLSDWVETNYSPSRQN